MNKKTRRRFSGSEKVEILKRHYVGGEVISKICEELGLNPNQFYQWQQKFFENGAKAFESDRVAESKQLQQRVEGLEAKLQRKDAVLSELMEEHVALKKNLGEI